MVNLYINCYLLQKEPSLTRLRIALVYGHEHITTHAFCKAYVVDFCLESLTLPPTSQATRLLTVCRVPGIYSCEKGFKSNFCLSVCILSVSCQEGVKAHAFNYCTWKAEVGRSVSIRDIQGNIEKLCFKITAAAATTTASGSLPSSASKMCAHTWVPTGNKGSPYILSSACLPCCF